MLSRFFLLKIGVNTRLSGDSGCARILLTMRLLNWQES